MTKNSSIEMTEIIREASLDLGGRREEMARARRIVIKIGSAVLSDGKRHLNVEHLGALAGAISKLHGEKREILMVSSGAVLAGRDLLANRISGGAGGAAEGPRRLADEQALAALGQSRLVEEYRKAFGAYGVKVAQVLLTKSDMEDLRRYQNARRTFERLLDWGIVPIINENDSTTVEELRMGDNDELSALVAKKMRADLLVLLTSASGLMTGDPRVDPEARLIEAVESINSDALERLEVPADQSGRGGIKGKLKASKIAMDAGVSVVIASGQEPETLLNILAGKGGLGTYLRATEGAKAANPVRTFLSNEQSRALGAIIVNDGAARALRERGASLLPVGIARVEGDFDAGEVVMVSDEAGQAVGRGIVDYRALDLAKLAGHQTGEIPDLIGYDNGPTAIHRDQFILASPARFIEK